MSGHLVPRSLQHQILGSRGSRHRLQVPPQEEPRSDPDRSDLGNNQCVSNPNRESSSFVGPVVVVAGRLPPATDRSVCQHDHQANRRKAGE